VGEGGAPTVEGHQAESHPIPALTEFIRDEASRRHLKQVEHPPETCGLADARSTGQEARPSHASPFAAIMSETLYGERGVKFRTDSYWLGHGRSYPCS